MKVAYLLGALERGGTETLMLDTLRQVKRENLDYIAIHRKKGVLLSEFKSTEVPLYYYPIKYLFDFGYLIRLRRLLKKEEIKIVHAQIPLDAFLAYWACLGTNIKLILSFHGYDFNDNWLAKLIVDFIILRTDLNIYVSQHLRTHYTTIHTLAPLSNKQQVLYNGVDFDKFNVHEIGNLRQELGIPSNALLIGSVGNFVAGRDQLTICRFIYELSKINVDFRFVFVGAKNSNSTHLYDNCVEFCRENNLAEIVYFLGSRQDVPSILKQLDAFVYASEYDTFGIAVVEAISVGVPVFVNDWVVMCEITNDGSLATLYKTKNEKDLLNKFNYFLQHKSEIKEKSFKNSIFIKKKFNIQNYLHKLQEHYISL